MVLGLGRRQMGPRVVFAATVLTFAAFTGVAGWRRRSACRWAQFLGGMVPIDSAGDRVRADDAADKLCYFRPRAAHSRWCRMCAGAGRLRFGMLPAILAFIIRRRGLSRRVARGAPGAGASRSRGAGAFQDMGSLAMTVYAPDGDPCIFAARASRWRWDGPFRRHVGAADRRINAGPSMLVRCVIAGGMLLASGLTLVLAYEIRGDLELVSPGAD